MEKDLELSDIPATDLQHKTIGSIFIEDFIYRSIQKIEK